MRLPLTATTALAIVALVGCGRPGAAADLPQPSTSCQASTSDVAGDPQSLPIAGNATAPVDFANRQAEAVYAATHAAISEVGVFSQGYDYVGFTTDQVGNLAALRATAPHPALIRAYCARWSDQAEQQVMHRLMVSEHATLLGQNIDVREASPSFAGVVVTVAHVTTDTRARLQTHYGPIIATVIEGPGGLASGF